LYPLPKSKPCLPKPEHVPLLVVMSQTDEVQHTFSYPPSYADHGWTFCRTHTGLLERRQASIPAENCWGLLETAGKEAGFYSCRKLLGTTGDCWEKEGNKSLSLVILPLSLPPGNPLSPLLWRYDIPDRIAREKGANPCFSVSIVCPLPCFWVFCWPLGSGLFTIPFLPVIL